MQNQKVSKTLAKAWIVEVDLKATGERLRSKRHEYHLTREGLSHRLTQDGLSTLFTDAYDPASRETISAWENGWKLPSITHLGFLKKLYNCTLDELVVFSFRLDGDEDDQPVLLIEYLIEANIWFHHTICSSFVIFLNTAFSLALCQFGGIQIILVVCQNRVHPEPALGYESNR